MKRFFIFTVFLLSCLLSTGILFAASPEVERAKRHGAQGQVTVRVIDSTGKPVEKAKLSVAFWTSDSSANAVVAEGQTDTNGCYVATGKTIHSMNYTVTKENYYSTEGAYWFYRRGENCIQDGRWLPWNPTNTVVLKERRKPIAMYVKYVDQPVPVRDRPVGFDLEVGDWVAPHGQGKHSDFYLTYKAEAQDLWTGSYELDLLCSNRLEGFYRAEKDMWSELRSCYEAPSDGYRTQVVLCLDRTKYKILKKEQFGESEYLAFRVRTLLDDKGNLVSAMYGKIYGPIEFGVGKEHHVRFTYYFNPTPNDRNIEFDPNRNLFIFSERERSGYLP